MEVKNKQKFNMTKKELYKNGLYENTHGFSR